MPAAEADLMIRPATPVDAEAMFALHRRSVLSLCREAYGPRQLEAWFVGRSPAIYAPALAAGQLHVACRGDAILGFVGAEPGEVTLLFVDPAAAGSGIGKALFEFGLEAARAGHAGPLRVVATRNSQRFYERYGFAEVGRDAIERGEPIVRIEVIEMRERDS
jgi:GNAT superfamily N-acetyltransferase